MALLARLPIGNRPVSIVTQRRAPPIVDGIAEGLRARMPQAEVTEIGAGHMIPLTDAGDLVKHLRGLWGLVDPAP